VAGCACSTKSRHTPRMRGMTTEVVSRVYSSDIISRSRDAMRPRFARNFLTLFQNRGRRESRMPIAPAVGRTKSARVDHRRNRITPAFPARMGYGLLRALPGDRAFLPPSPCGLTMHRKPGWAGCISAKLDASIGAPGPHNFAVRDHLRQRSRRTSYHPASFVEDGLQHRSSARRPIAHGKSRPAIPCAPDAVASIASHPA
jgi:hypothetical protein